MTNPHDPHGQRELLDRLCSLEQAIEKMKDVASRNFLSGEIEGFSFDGAAGRTRWTDDHGSNALAYAVYNPNEFRVFVGLAGTSASSDGLIVPKQRLVVAPLQINGHVELAADEEQLAKGSGRILRVRFPTPQPFYVGALA